MGNRSAVLTNEQLNEYAELTYLTKTEIVYIHRKFQKLNLNKILENNIQSRFELKDLIRIFPEIRYNPFKDRMIKIFSSKNDEKLSFEDALDLCSAFSPNCPLNIKAIFAFRIFDFDNDNQISKDDLKLMLERMTDNELTPREKDRIADVFMKEMKLTLLLGMSQIDFIQFINKISEFATVFSFHP